MSIFSMKKVFYINPVPASRPRVSRWSVFYPKKYTQFKEDMKVLTDKLDIEPLEGLLEADIAFFVQIPKSWSKKNKLAKEGAFCDNNADIDNYAKQYLIV